MIEKELADFDAYSYIVNELRVIKVEYWTDRNGYQYKITIKNDDGENASFVISRGQLVSYKKALRVFTQFIGRIPKRLPKGVEEEV